MTVEGFFSGSPHAQDRTIIAWPLKGFPGAYFREDATAEGLTAKKPVAMSQSQR
jgi:hypothetical protein